jgi:hypothetical protein
MFGIAILNRIWPAGWAWEPEQPAYLHMIFSIYFVLGIFLLRAARDPARHLSPIWFTVWSSLGQLRAGRNRVLNGAHSCDELG